MSRIIIVGAGAAGLMAGRELVKRNFDVTIVEGRDRIGGRMNTILPTGFNRYIDEGAEFVHGNLPLTLSLFAEAGIDYHPMDGDIYNFSEGALEKEKSFFEDAGKLTKELKKLEVEMTVREFLETRFDNQKDKKLIDSVRRFIEGYDSADYSIASALAFKAEWLSEDEDAQNRPVGGYQQLYTFLHRHYSALGGKTLLNKTVKKIDHHFSTINVLFQDGTVLSCDKIIVTIPLGIMKSPQSKAFIEFEPRILSLEKFVNGSGFGNVIKIILQFEKHFWNKKTLQCNQNTAPDFGFIFSEEKIPTWWTQLPDNIPIITGWTGGPPALEMSARSKEDILQLALTSLANIFNLPSEQIKSHLSAFHIKDWNKDPFTQGAYAYRTPETLSLLQEFNDAVNEKVYFAGEAFYAGKEMGTVEAALSSGWSVSRHISPK